MILLYISLILMLSVSLCLISMPFIKNKKRLSSGFYLTASLTILLALSLYYFSSNFRVLQFWITQGQSHYQLLEKLDQLGGVEGVITRITEKLKIHPDDAQGWFILGKLYLSKQDKTAAKAAFAKAHALRPNDPEIDRYYQMLP
jgi:cytochrome c-type biogenesis protein CcmH/NrfG